jgi:UDP-glucose 4-epimerase
VLASSGAIYGDQEAQPLSEGQAPRPLSPYAVSKLAAEYYIRTIGTLWGIESVSLRVFNAYGPGQRLPASHPPVVPYLLHQAVQSGTMMINGDGSQTRDYVYVDDVISSLVAAATAPNINGLVINIGSGTETSVLQLAKLVRQVTGSDSDVITSAQTSGGVARMCANIALAERRLNYTPSIKLEDGLQMTLQRDASLKPGSNKHSS